MASDEDNHRESEFYYPDETENCNGKENISSLHDENHQGAEFTMDSVQKYFLTHFGKLFKVPFLLRNLKYCFPKPLALICITSIFITVFLLHIFPQILRVAEKRNKNNY